jgi:hypothetical protein
MLRLFEGRKNSAEIMLERLATLEASREEEMQMPILPCLWGGTDDGGTDEVWDERVLEGKSSSEQQRGRRKHESAQRKGKQEERGRLTTAAAVGASAAARGRLTAAKVAAVDWDMEGSEEAETATAMAFAAAASCAVDVAPAVEWLHA